MTERAMDWPTAEEARVLLRQLPASIHHIRGGDGRANGPHMVYESARNKLIGLSEGRTMALSQEPDPMALDAAVESLPGYVPGLTSDLIREEVERVIRVYLGALDSSVEDTSGT